MEEGKLTEQEVRDEYRKHRKDKAFAECWYDKNKCTDVKYCADGSGLTTCPGPLSVGPHNLVWGIALDEGGINNQDMTGIPNVNNNNSPLIYWCLGGAWAPIGTS